MFFLILSLSMPSTFFLIFALHSSNVDIACFLFLFLCYSMSNSMCPPALLSGLVCIMSHATRRKHTSVHLVLHDFVVMIDFEIWVSEQGKTGD